MDKQLLGSIVLGIMGVTTGIAVLITTYKYSLTMVPLDSSILIGLIVMIVTLGISMTLFNSYIRSMN